MEGSERPPLPSFVLEVQRFGGSCLVGGGDSLLDPHLCPLTRLSPAALEAGFLPKLLAHEGVSRPGRCRVSSPGQLCLGYSRFPRPPFLTRSILFLPPPVLLWEMKWGT